MEHSISTTYRQACCTWSWKIAGFHRILSRLPCKNAWKCLKMQVLGVKDHLHRSLCSFPIFHCIWGRELSLRADWWSFWTASFHSCLALPLPASPYVPVVFQAQIVEFDGRFIRFCGLWWERYHAPRGTWWSLFLALPPHVPEGWSLRDLKMWRVQLEPVWCNLPLSYCIQTKTKT